MSDTPTTSDIAMAGENGYEFIRKLRSLDPEAGGRIPAIALTAYAGAADRRRALLAGFQTHMQPDDLLSVILSLTFQHTPGSEMRETGGNTGPPS